MCGKWRMHVFCAYILLIHLAPGWNPHCSSKEKDEKEAMSLQHLRTSRLPYTKKNKHPIAEESHCLWPVPPQRRAASLWAYYLQGMMKVLLA